MPSSRYQVIPLVLDLVTAIQPKSILDVGIGFGKWAVLFREYLDVWKTDKPFQERVTRIDGVEAFSEYENSVWKVYDNIYVGDVINLIPELKEHKYDLIFLGDVIEHFDKEEGKKLLAELNYEHMIIVTPFQVLPQKAVYDNQYEIHKSEWKHQDLIGFELKVIGNQQIYYK